MRRKKKGVPMLVKTIPLSVAITAFSSGILFANAGEGYDQIIIDAGDDGKLVINADELKGDNRAALIEAFLNEKSIVLAKDDKKVEFGLNASDQVSIEEIWANPEKYPY